MNWTISPLTAWIIVLGPEPYGALSNCALVRLFAMISTVTFASHCIVHVAVELLFPVFVSVLVVLIFAVFANTYHDVSKFVSVHVSIIVPPLHAGSVPIVNVVAGNEILGLIISVSTTPEATLPQLFPYVIV